MQKHGLRNIGKVKRIINSFHTSHYLNDIKDENELAQRYENLDLTKRQRKVINDYVACASTANHRYADISYMCGIKDTVSLLVSLGLIKGVEAEE